MRSEENVSLLLSVYSRNGVAYHGARDRYVEQTAFRKYCRCSFVPAAKRRRVIAAETDRAAEPAADAGAAAA